MGRATKKKLAKHPEGGCVELTAGLLQTLGRVEYDDSVLAYLWNSPKRPVRTEEGALAMLRLIPPQVVYRGDTAADGYRLSGCIEITRLLVAACDPETPIRCLLEDGPAKEVDPAMLGTLMHIVCSIDEIAAWCTQPEVWEWWDRRHPSVSVVAELLGLGRDKTNALLHVVAEKRKAEVEKRGVEAERRRAAAECRQAESEKQQAEGEPGDASPGVPEP